MKISKFFNDYYPEEKKMFNKLFEIFAKDIQPLADIASYIGRIIDEFESHEATDKNDKNAFLDTLIEIIQAHKEVK